MFQKIKFLFLLFQTISMPVFAEGVVLKEDFDTLLNDGRETFIQKNYEGALVFFDKAHALNPSDFNAILGLAKSYYGCEQYENAIKFFNMLFVDNSDFLTIADLSEYADALINLESYYNAKIVLQKILAIDPQNFFALNRLGYLAHIEKDYLCIIEIQKNILLRYPHSFSALMNLGLAYYDIRDYEIAKGYFLEFIELYADDKSAQIPETLIKAKFFLGSSHFYLEEYDQAAEMFLSIPEGNPRYEKAQHCLQVIEDLKMISFDE